MMRDNMGIDPTTVYFDARAKSARGTTMSRALYMVIEYYKNGDAVPVYRRFRDHGRLTPEGLFYVSS